MEGQIYQLCPQACGYCGQACVQPQTSTYTDMRTNELVTEAVWSCHRCGSKFQNGEVSRIKQNG